MRRPLALLAGFLALLPIAAAALWLWRLPLAEWALARWLEDRGLEGSAEVVRLDLEGAVVEALRLDGQSAGRVAVAYDLPGLLDGRVERVEVEGLRLAADLTAERPLGRLVQAFAGSGEEPAADGGLALPVLPPIALRDARLDLVTARGPLSLRLDGGLAEAEDLPDPARRLSLGLATLEGPVALSGRAEGVYRPGDGAGSRLELSLAAAEGPPLSLSAEAELGAEALALDLDLQGDAPLLASLATLPSGLLPEAGRASLQASAEVAAAPLLAGGIAALLAEPGAVRALRADLALEGLALPGRARGLALGGGLALAGPADARRLRLRPMQASAEALDPGWLQALGLPAPFAAALAEGGRLRLRAPGDAPDAAPAVLTLEEAGPSLALDAEASLAPVAGGSLGATLEGSLALSPDGTLLDSDVALSSLTARGLPMPYGLLRSADLQGRFQGVPRAASGHLEGSLALADLTIEGAYAADLEAELALDLDWDEQGPDLRLARPGRLALQGFAEPLAPLLGRVELAVEKAHLSLGGTTRVEATAALAPLPLDLDGSGRDDDLTVAAEAVTLDLALPEGGGVTGTAAADGLDLVYREQAVALRDARLSAELGGEKTALELEGGRLVSLAEPALFPPLAVSGSGSLAGSSLDYRLVGRGLDGALGLVAGGSQDLQAGSGRLRLDLEPLRFAPGGLQPAGLTPALAALEQASGSLSAEASLRLGGSGLAGTASVTLQGIGFSLSGTRVEGLDLDLALDSLDPPASPPGQPFSIARVEAGVPVTDVRGTLDLEAEDGGTVIRVGSATASFLGGTLALEDARLAPAAGRYALTLQVREVELERLLALAELEEVTGSGRLSGEIPIRVEDGAVVVEGGALDALSPGVIAFRSEAARRALASGGESVELMLRALENFHYEVLRLTLDKPAEGESRVFLKLEGANPEVLDGQPFVLNVNLTSNAAPLLAALARGTEISDRLVEELLRGRQ